MKVLNSGFIELIDMMGDDNRILDSARVSTGASSKGEKKDKGLINYLLKNKHHTPFEKVVFEFHVRTPIFVARQWFRHRMGSFNEESGRYKEFKWNTFAPSEWRKQATKNHQSSSDERFSEKEEKELYQLQQSAYYAAQEAYEKMLYMGVSRELARTVMPVGQYTEFYWTVNYRSLMNFLTLRNHGHAQPEIREYAIAIEEMLSKKEELKYSWEAFQSVRHSEHLFIDALNHNMFALQNTLEGLK